MQRRPYARPRKPALVVQPTTLWEYPSQHYGEGQQGDQRYVGATPSYVVWNLIQRYTKPGDLVVDPFCGSGTTIDVAKDTGRLARGFDLAPYRPDIEKGDARSLPLENGAAKLVFMDPPYGDHIHYSDDPACIGRLSAHDPAYYKAMHRAIREAARAGKTAVCEIEADHIHNLPSLLHEANEARHHCYIVPERKYYIARLEEHGDADYAEQQLRQYKDPWKVLMTLALDELDPTRGDQPAPE